ncbi:hypothetical protein RAA17_19685 [Komagataeibacter rhaeticus]|nr:hypothetical protein [Komagataeibacter rhaeticus]
MKSWTACTTNLRPGLRRAALLNLQAHLEKLVEDAKVTRQGTCG